MKLFRSRAEKELDGIINELKQFLSNNYKDQAHLMRTRLKARADELKEAGKLSDELYAGYVRIYEQFTEDMKNYNHREFYKS